jgi:hypothetical protein
MKVDKNLEQLAKFQPLFSRKRFCAVPPPISISPLTYLLSQRRGQRVANEKSEVVAIGDRNPGNGLPHQHIPTYSSSALISLYLVKTERETAS